jgi:hypothetical protein
VGSFVGGLVGNFVGGGVGGFVGGLVGDFVDPLQTARDRCVRLQAPSSFTQKRLCPSRVRGLLTVVVKRHQYVVRRCNAKRVRTDLVEAVTHHLNVVLCPGLRIPSQIGAGGTESGAAEGIRRCTSRVNAT